MIANALNVLEKQIKNVKLVKILMHSKIKNNVYPHAPQKHSRKTEYAKPVINHVHYVVNQVKNVMVVYLDST